MALTKSEVRSQKSEVVFETEIYAPSQKRFAFKGGVLDPIIFDKFFGIKVFGVFSIAHLLQQSI